MKNVLAIRHVAFEDLGSFEPLLAARGYALRYADAGLDDLAALDPEAPDLLIVLGGPIGACEEDTYPFLRDELALIERRLARQLPLLGICLGAQLIARSLGARVYPAREKELGFAPIALTAEGARSCLHPYAADGTVLHWHGDTFDLPRGAVRLASTAICENQAFSYGPAALALQFHIEAPAQGFERWLVGHAHELSSLGLSVPSLREQAGNLAPALAAKAARTLAAWLAQTDMA